jgi:3'-phosphoadenosine 5'-phosphosulfate sulfotransferase (PAPS reductase)/FAD synthetase
MSLQTVLDSLPKFKSDEIIKSFVKGYSIINKDMYKRPICSISGGSDSDIMLDLIYRIDEQKKVTYVWFDTGLEYKATKEHLKYLENRYNIEIRRERAVKPIPVCTREYGQPFLNKLASDYISRLQRHGFDWKTGEFDELYEQYPNCKGVLLWWCNKRQDPRFNINRNKWLKEFLIRNPPTFKISNKCCTYAKKKAVARLNKDLEIVGIRKAEGGIRAAAYKNCYTQGENQYRPLFWFKEEDKRVYEQAFGIKHSDCYEKWGLLRTGCVGCPYGRELFYELDVVSTFEPNMYKAVNNIFKESYEYTKQYRQFVKEMNDKEKRRKRLF